MPDHPNQPQQYDAVLGEQTPIRAGSAILGGLEGVKRHLDSAVEEQRIAALSEALKYGEVGLDLVIGALQDESEKLRSAAYLLLRERTEPKVKQTLKDYNPWQFVTCLHTLLHPSLSYYERRQYYGDLFVRSVAISRDGQTLVSAGGDKTIKIWHIPTGQLTRTLTGDSSLYAVAISPDGQTLVSGNNGGTIQVWHIPTGQLTRTLVEHSRLYAVAISPDGQTLVGGNNGGTIQIWHLPTGKLIRTLRAHSYRQVTNRQVTRTLRGHSGSIRSVAISRDGQTLVSCSTDHTIKIWHLPTGQLTRTLEEDSLYGVSSVAVSPGGQTVVSAGGRDGIKVSNLSMSPIGQMSRTLGADPFRCSVVAISPDGETLVSDSTDHTIKIWHLPTGQLTKTLVGHSDLVTSLAISQDGQTFVTRSKDGTIKVWGVP